MTTSNSQPIEPLEASAVDSPNTIDVWLEGVEDRTVRPLRPVLARLREEQRRKEAASAPPPKEPPANNGA